MSFSGLGFEVADGLATVTINRPEKRNALDRATLGELDRAFAAIAADAAVRAVILTGAGDRAFVAGADIEEMAGLAPAEARAFSDLGQAVFARIEGLDRPVIAAINGFALGGGLELAMAAHLRLAADRAELGQPEIALGLIPGFAGTQRLTRLVGRERALELILSGRRIGAAEAERIGLVGRVVPAAELMAEARALGGRIAGQAPLAVRAALEAVTRGSESGFAAGSRLESTLFGLLFASEDMREGTRAFLEKRKPAWQGR